MEGADASGRASQLTADGTKALFDAGRAARVVGMNGYCIVRSAIDPTFLRDTVRPAFDAHFTSVVLPRRPQPNRGPGRYQAVLPLTAPFIDPRLVGADMIVRVLDHLLGPDFVLSLASSHVALPGCEQQEPHIDYEPLFDTFLPLPPYCVYVHIPLVDLTPDNGPTEFWSGSPHMAISSVISSLREFSSLPIDVLPSDKVLLNVGDVVIKDMRCFHRGTANTTDQARPMLSLIYSRKWYRLPYEKLYKEEGYPPMAIKKKDLDRLPPHLQPMFRFCRVAEPEQALEDQTQPSA
ncbi:Phytanoyl-CoA dioxygenase [Acanthamoeba castellanii str. Neff]|uniref:Phytanoyl-CoA dioxygenase n=1 Tax=Acanthamoeba castellanii (strain ATCC 30010 / Neff) TaxID=1257118 RepID=L8GPS5_ACACF|nr:Phytanoyl-CoA dioxygenase [Acanthamoeba castellanii str. Neff]ELR14633.1 Phytanoyl-CoA dioxygenase [Acanthamoeba castellanii str. Neff]